MVRILLISDNEDKAKLINGILEQSAYELCLSTTLQGALEDLKIKHPDIVILDSSIASFDVKVVNTQIKSFGENLLSILLVGEGTVPSELLKSANAFIKEPIEKNLLLATISANLKAKSSRELLFESNQELARSLYQLNVLYNTSSQFAGTLDKQKLMNFMVEGMDKSLNFSLACMLTFRAQNEPILVIHSLYQIPDRLLEALKLRTILNYKSLFEKKEIPFEIKIDRIKIEKHVKHSMKEYDFSLLRYDNMFAPINLSENFFGFIEIYRESEFSTEDATCFQTLAQQVSLPLKSASLYEEIKDTNKKLERLERLKSEFISIVSHELRTPLTAIKNSMDIVLSGKAGQMTENMNKFISMAKRNVLRLSGIINDLLDISKIEAGKMDFKFAVTTIAPAIEYVKSSLDEMAKEKNISLVVRIEDDAASIYADSHRLEQVLTNLVSNSIKFTPEGGKIEICTQVVDARNIQYFESFEPEIKKLSGKYVMVRVKDNGIGIAQENLAQIFDKFAQIENSLSRQVGGSGLGLPIARQLLDAHNGAIWCNSKLEKGSSFYFAVPVSSEKSNFMLEFKQNLQKAKVNNSSLALVQLSGTSSLIQSILAENNLINKSYLTNSLTESKDGESVLTMTIVDGDSYSADFLRKKLEGYLSQRGNLYPNCVIMYAYAIYPQDASDERELLGKVKNAFVRLQIGAKD